MTRRLIAILALVLALALPVAPAFADNPNLEGSISADVNPSVVGQTVTYTVSGLHDGNRTYYLQYGETTVPLTFVNHVATAQVTYTTNLDYVVYVQQALRNGGGATVNYYWQTVCTVLDPSTPSGCAAGGE